ncbi:MAG: hypothetical protein R2692_03835 [Microbacterium sp.]
MPPDTDPDVLTDLVRTVCRDCAGSSVSTTTTARTRRRMPMSSVVGNGMGGLTVAYDLAARGCA